MGGGSRSAGFRVTLYELLWPMLLSWLPLSCRCWWRLRCGSTTTHVRAQLNAIAGHLYVGAVLSAEGAAPSDATEAGADAGAGAGASREVAELTFAPEKGNVLFASAAHGWAFDLGTFAALYARKLGVNRDVLQRTLWGEYFFQPKTKRVSGAMPPIRVARQARIGRVA